ncbi:MAG: C1 family peptidase, partial [Bacteroidota bacterium]
SISQTLNLPTMLRSLLLFLISLGFFLCSQAQEEIRSLPGTDYAFTTEVDLSATPVKNQGASGTCWSFSTVSFLESELIRMGKGEHDLSEMFVVRKIYPAKAQRYVRLHGHSQFSPGGTFHDVNNVLREHGVVPQAAYGGKVVNSKRHDHGELDRVLESFVETVVKSRGELTDRWPVALEGILDAYLGVVPTTFQYQGKSYTPQSFAEMLELDADNYYEFTSLASAPYYQKIELEIPDNWDAHRMYNIPLEELMDLMESAVREGYTVAWDGDVSEKGFEHRKGIATLGEMENEEITPGLRQAAFDNYATTDDHLMHLTGLAKDQTGRLFFLTKNSWGDSNSCGGFLYMSEPYARMKTVHIMVHQDAVPKEVMQQLKK